MRADFSLVPASAALANMDDDDISSDSTFPSAPAMSQGSDARLRAIVEEHFDFVWRSLRRLGVAPESVDDAAQSVFWIVARKIDDIAVGSERSYLFGSAVRIASNFRRMRSRVRETAGAPELDNASHPIPGPDELLEQKRAREILDGLLEDMPMELRTVLVLVEGEGLTGTEVAELLSIPEGTVNSRLRRAREALRERVSRMQKRSIAKTGTRT
jgi:RNA polymerase sigma-70 factor (ECF subfamily)